MSYEAELRVWVDSLKTDILSFDKANGKKRRLVLRGHIDVPHHEYPWRFWDSETASCLSSKPIDIHFFESPSHLYRILRESYGDEAIGILRTEDAEDIAQFPSDAFEYSLPPIDALLELPHEVLETIREQLSRCQLENRFLFLTLKFRVLSVYIKPDTDEFNKEDGLRPADIDFSAKREFEVFNIETAVSDKKAETEVIL